VVTAITESENPDNSVAELKKLIDFKFYSIFGTSKKGSNA
jgi:hypothetical protein